MFKKLQNVLLALALWAGVSAVAMAQTASGTVVDTQGLPIPGASVIVKGTTTGTMTAADGTFSIAARSGAVLEISCIGYASQEINAGTGLMVTLKEDNEFLEESVVTALGIKRERKALGYSVSEVNSDELLKNKQTNVVNSLAGKVPGVNVTQSSGAAGAGASIIIRGANSTSEGRDNTPLFVVDGVIYDNSTTVFGNSGSDGMTRSNTTYSNRVMDINPEDIESMSILKGAAAAALYGSRAADGAIIITTKKGAEGSAKVEYAGKVSVSWANKLPKAQTQFGRGRYEINGVLNEQTYQTWGAELAANADIYDNINGFFRNGIIYDNNVSVSGGSKNGSFFLSLSNFDQKGVVPNTGYNKTTVRFNGEQKYGKLTVTANAAYSIAKTQEDPDLDQDYDGDSEASFTDKETIEAAIISIITDNNAEGKETGLGEIGSRLVKIFPDFDVRNYHYSKLSEYLKDFPSLKVENRDNAVWVSLNSSTDSEIEQQILRIFKKHDTDDMYLATLKKELLELNPNLEASIRRIGVTRFSVYLHRMIGSVEVNGRHVTLKR